MKEPGQSTLWQGQHVATRAALLVALGWGLYMLLYLYKLFDAAGIVIYPIAQRAVSAGAITVIVFLLQPARGGRRGGAVPWHDWLAIAMVVASCGYVVLYAEQFVFQWGDARPFEMLLGIGLMLALLEATRRTVGLSVTLLVVAAFFYTVYSNHFPGFLMSVGFSYARTVGWLYLSGEGLWGQVIGVVATIVVAFVIFGALLRATGASQFFSDLALGLVGGLRGGPAKAAVVASTLFGTISGSVAANVATTGQVTIPLMIKSGYRRDMAGAIEATASTGGMFTPPVMGATAFLIAEYLRLDYWQVCLAAAIPAALYYLVLLLQVDLEAARIGARGLDRRDLPSLRATLVGGWHYLVPFVALGMFMGVLDYSAESAILYTLIVLVVVSYRRREDRLTLTRLMAAIYDSARNMMAVAPLCTAVGVIVGALTLTGTGATLSSALADMSDGNMLLMLVLAAFASFVLGMGMTAVTCYILSVVLLAPALIQTGVQPMAAHMFLFYFGCLSFITPPVAVGAYVAASISGGNPWQTGLHSIRLGAAAFLVPFAFVYNPALLMIGDPWQIAGAVLFAIAGMACVSAAIAGFALAPLPVAARLAWAAAGLGLMVPDLQTRGIAAAAAALLLLRHWQTARQRAAQAAA